MEAAFTKLQNYGKNDVENLIKWFKDSKVIDATKDQEDKVRSFFDDATDKNNISLEKFKEITRKVADEFNTCLDAITKKLAEGGPRCLQDVPIGKIKGHRKLHSRITMEAVFSNLQKDGKNDVENLVKWMKDSKVIDQSKAQEDKVRGFFDSADDKNNVSLEKFKEVMKKVADEFKVDLDAITKKLVATGPKLLQDVVGGTTSTLAAAKDLLPKF